ncbi:hypothetical protein JB92DRAFT_3116745 [Gautieria morchelliformis]|nr:hypothetical protein JB92DRAFT_3116745 [Gautieria morchelliformis]
MDVNESSTSYSSGLPSFVNGQRIEMGSHGPLFSGHLTKREEDSLDAQVLCRVEASALQLQTGDTTPGSVPLANISPILSDPRKARYQRTQSQTHLELAPSPTKGGLPFLNTFGKLHEQRSTRFLLDSAFHHPTYVVVQTPWMQQCVLAEAVDDWINTPSGEGDARHRFVTDGDHSFFKSGVLLATCAFSRTLETWAPTMYTWIQSQDIAHHQPHFKQMFHQVVDAAGQRFDAKLLLNVMDYSVAACAAHASKYSVAMTSRLVNFPLLSPEAQALELRRYEDEATTAPRFHRAPEQASTAQFKSSERLSKGMGVAMGVVTIQSSEHDIPVSVGWQ